jgi:hypothetical protein
MNTDTIKIINESHKRYGDKLYMYSKYIEGIIDFENIKYIVPIIAIICSDNMYITNIINIPDSVKLLDCKNNRIKNFKNLPISLEKLLCDNNLLTNLDNLPGGLKFLSCDENKLVNLNNLPLGLEYLSCCSNPIESLENLPFTLKKLYAFGCSKLKSLDYLPDSIDEINCDNNIMDISKYNFPTGFESDVNNKSLNYQFGIKKNKIKIR